MTDLSLLQDFIPETIEHLEELENNLLRFEANPGDGKILSNIFRAAHTIKGSAEYLGMKRISTIAHKLENLLEILRQGNRQPDTAILDTLIESRDRIASLVKDLQNFQEERTPVEDIVKKIDRLTAHVSGKEEEKPEEDDILGIGDDLEPLADDLDLEESGDTAAPRAPEPEDLDLAPGEPDVLPGPEPVSQQPVPDGLPMLSKDESYDEEYDDELFQIFVEHLTKNLATLHQLSEKMSVASDPKTFLNESLEIIASLRSSAAYMDYGKLAAFYDEWNAYIRRAGESISSGQKVPFAFMDMCANQISSRFSSYHKEEAAQSAQPKPAEPAPVALPPRQEELVSVLEEDQLKEEESASLLEEQRPEEKQAPKQKETQGLFDELDSVFEASGQAAPVADTDADPFAEDLEEALSAPRPVPDPKPVQPPAAPKPAQLAEAPSPAPSLPEKEQPAPVQGERGKAVLPPPHEEPLESSLKEEPVPVPAKEAAADSSPVAAPTGEEKKGMVQMDDLSTDRMLKQTLRVDASKIDTLMNQAGELVVNRASYAQLCNDLKDFRQVLKRSGLEPKALKQVRDITFRLTEATVALGRVANDLQEGVMKVRMLPIAQLFNRYPRLVRDLVHNTGKIVHLEMRGEDTELDKMVIEEISDPLVHIIRNAVDHGIETAAERRAKGKPETGTVRLESYHESNHVVVEISDDGRGIDPAEILSVARQKGLVANEELDRMRDKEILSIIMMPGFSTSKEVTTTSGRGVGMDVVKKNVEKLNGTVEIDTKKGQGTRIRIKIPLTLAIIQALLVKVGGEIFTIPLSVVEETLRIRESDITLIEGVEVIQLREGVLSLLRLTQEFKKKSHAPDPEQAYVVVVNTGMRQVGMVVDSLIGQEEAVIKPLADYLQEGSGFSGATILGDGRVSLILDVYELVNICMRRQASRKL